MSLTKKVLFTTLCLLGALLPPANARLVRIWQPGELVQKADLIVIATVRASGNEKDYDYKSAKPASAVPVDTQFDVEAVLKGPLIGKMLTVRHERYADAKMNVFIVDGPDYVTFNPKKKNQYLLYLAKVGDHYEPLTGQYDPDQSFSQITPYDGAQEAAAPPPAPASAQPEAK